ncbi:cell division control protein, partial [Spiromyces aspiralis]
SFCDTFIKARLRSESLDDTPILSKEDIDSNIEKSPPLKRGSLSSSASAPKRDLHYLFDTTAPTTVMSARTLLVKDQATGNKRHIKLIDTPGLEPENPQQASLIVQQAIDHIEHQYARHLREELKVRRQRHIPIQMVHVVLYFLAPPVQNRETPAYGPRAQRFRSPTDIITEMDLQAMSTLSKRANVIPVLGKADLLTLAERQTVQNGRLFADLSRMYPDLKLYNFNVTPEIEEPETPGGMLRPMDPAIPGRSGSTGENGATDNDDDNDDEDLGSGDAAMRRSARVSLLDAAQAADMPASSIQHALLRQAPFLVVGSEHVAEYQNAIADMIHYDNPELELSFMERERIDPSSGSPHGGSPGHSGGDMSGEGERSASSSSSEGSSRVVRSRNNSDSSFHSHGSSSRRVIPDRPPVLPSIEGLSSDGLMKRKSVVSNRSRRYSLRRAPPTSFAAAAAAANPARRYIGRSGHAGWRPRSRFLPETEVPDLMSLKGPTMAIERGGYREQIFLGRQFAW